MLRQGCYHKNLDRLRYHKIKVAFFGDEGKLLEEKEVVLQNREVTEITYNASLGVKAVVPNYGDLTFIKVDLDSVSAGWLRTNLFAIEDDLTRALIWRCFYDGVRDGVLIKCTDFLDLAH